MLHLLYSYPLSPLPNHASYTTKIGDIGLLFQGRKCMPSFLHNHASCLATSGVSSAIFSGEKIIINYPTMIIVFPIVYPITPPIQSSGTSGCSPRRENRKVVFCRVRTEPYPGYFPGYYARGTTPGVRVCPFKIPGCGYGYGYNIRIPTRNFCEF